MVYTRRAPPLWCLLCVAVVAAVSLRLCWGAGTVGPLDGGHEPQPLLGLFGFIIAIAGVIFKGLQVAAKVTLSILSYSVKLLWLFATKTANGLAVLGRGVLTGLQKAWKFFQLTYDKVLKPAWQKFWNWFDKFRRWLDATFTPVLEFLRDVRDGILDFWKTYIRPWLDLIDVSRRILRIFSALGLKWAAELDRRLGNIQDAIEGPFRYVLGKVNEIINVVNRIVTLDGLIQRLTLIRSLERDVKHILQAFHDRRREDITDADRAAARLRVVVKTTAQITQETRTYLDTGNGPRAALVDEWSQSLAIRLRSA